MNFLNFLTSGASLLNLNLQSLSQGFQKEKQLQNIPLGKQEQKPTELNNGSYSIRSVNSAFRPGTESKDEEQLRKMLLNQEQMLINQYMELNLQYLTKKMNLSSESLPKSPVQQANSGEKQKQEIRIVPGRKKIKKVNKCGHEDKAHYAKGMCNNCYHKYGRTKKPWNCSHTKLYAAGMCQNCYINNYNKKRREQKDGNGQQNAQIEEFSQEEVPKDLQLDDIAENESKEK